MLPGLHTYIHPDHAPQNAVSKLGIRAAIRRPSDSAPGGDGTNADLKKRNKSKEKFEFDENNAQIFRLRLDESHLQTRLFFNEYHNSFILSLVGISSLLLSKYLGKSENGSGILANGNLIPVVFGIVSLCRVFTSLARVSFEKSGSKRSEKQLSAIIGAFWFFLGLVICFGVIPSIFDFDFRSVDVSWRVFVAAFVGLLAGILYTPAGKNARSFWLGTDQIRCR